MFIGDDDVQLYAVALGAGPRTLLALGGWAGSWEVWTETLSYLSETWRTVAYDHRGTGATIAPVDSITLPNMVDDVFTILDELGIEQCVLASESAGAFTAIQAALRHPERFSGLVVVDGVYQREQPDEPDMFARGLRANYPATLDQFALVCAPDPEQEAIRRWGRQILDRCAQPAAIALYECLYGVDLRPRIAEIALPTLVIHGSADALAPVEDAEWLAATIPGSRLVVLPGAGHIPTMTHPRAVADAINSFFGAPAA